MKSKPRTNRFGHRCPPTETVSTKHCPECGSPSKLLEGKTDYLICTDIKCFWSEKR
jgi:hypothetical protein